MYSTAEAHLPVLTGTRCRDPFVQMLLQFDGLLVNKSFSCAEDLLLSFTLGMRLIPARCIFVCAALH